MELTQENIDLIAKIIKNDRKYPNNEDLYEDFFNETCQRSMAIFDTIDDESALEAYLKKIVTTSIISVLKNSGRLRRSKIGYVPTKEVSIDDVSHESGNIAQLVDMPSVVASENTNVAKIHNISYSSISIPKNPEENAIRREILDFVARTIEKIDKSKPEKNYMKIFVMRYEKGMTQKQISNELGITQSEISKRIYGLIDKVKKVLDEQ